MEFITTGDICIEKNADSRRKVQLLLYIYYAKFILCLRMKPNSEPRVAHRYLEKAFHNTIALMPFLAGKLIVQVPNAQNPAIGRLEIHIPAKLDRDAMPKLAFEDLTSTIDYDDLMEAGLSEDELDGEKLLPAAYIPDFHAGADILVAQASFVDGGLLLDIGMFHSVTDGSGLNTIMKIWARECVELQSPESGSPPLEILVDSFDHGLLRKLWLAEGNKPVPSEELDTSEELWRLLGLNPADLVQERFLPVAPSAFRSADVPQMKTSIFYVSKESFAELKAAASLGDLTLGEDMNLSANDALMALLWRAIMTARCPEGRPANGDIQETTLDTTFDGRAHFSDSLPPSYLGNVILINTTRMPLLTLTSCSTTLGQIATEIRKSLNKITKERVHSAFAIASAIPDFTKLTFPFATFEGAERCATSLLQLPLFELNFGNAFANDGRPESVRPPRREFDSICRRCMVLPLRTHGRFEVLISLVKNEMQRLERDPEFTKYAKFCCY
ncbi:hypothetical protein LTR50_006884 [Elasticomyces elasticus]|nr:hypothetical protein LTR50_006884 [Elasticomyces elasticus]